MICKACGAPLGEGDTECPQCGTKVAPAEGGVGFWDMLSKPDDVDLTAQQAPAGSALLGAPEQQASPGMDPKVKRIIGSLGAAAAGGLLVASIMTLNTVQTIHSELQEHNLAMQQQVGALETTVSDISGKVDETWEVVSDQGSVMMVVSEPVDVAGESGSSSKAGEALLTMRVTGKPASFSWERRVDGAWQPVEFDEKTGVNGELGIKLVENVSEGVSSLAAAELSAAAAGEYRCVVSDAEGNVLGRSAILSVVEAADTPADEAPADEAEAPTDEAPADEAEAPADEAPTESAPDEPSDSIKG